MVYEEGVALNCCGGVLRGGHYEETDTSPPRMIRRCFEKDSDWNPMPCTGEGGCCKDVGGPCVPTTKGGYCGTRGGAMNARTKSKIMRDSQKGGEIDVSSDRSVQLDDIRDDPSIMLSPKELQGKKLRERRQRLKESQYSGDDISNITYSIELYNRYTTVLWLYILHIVFIVVLLILLREKIDKTIESYVGIFLQRSNEFTS
jgi:hypothetical protein